MYLGFCKGEEVCLNICSQDHSLVQIVSTLYSAGQDRLQQVLAFMEQQFVCSCHSVQQLHLKFVALCL